jgi:acyl-CoA thioester hydrolase
MKSVMLLGPDDPIPTPFVNIGQRVLPEWIDGNGHMNVAYYLKAFDEGFDSAFDAVGLGYQRVAETGFSSMTVDVHISYHRELFEAAPLRITTQLADCDEKRVLWVQAMYHANQGFLAATVEWLILSIDMRQRRVAPMPAEQLAIMHRVKAAHAGLSMPMQFTRLLSIHGRPKHKT